MNFNIVKRRVVRYYNSKKEEVVFVKGKGPYVYDSNGSQYLDCVLGYGPAVLGHANQQFNDLVANSLKDGIHLPGFSTIHETYLEHLLKDSKISSKVSVSFMKTSSESVTGAIRTATFYNGRKEILRCGFSGWHDSQHANSPSWHLPPNYRYPIRNLTGMRGVDGSEKVHNWISLELDELSQTLKKYGHNISCFMIDAFQLSFISDETLKEAIKLCRGYNILIIIDETKTAGRVSPLGVKGKDEELWDMLVLGKAIGNGSPISLLMVKEEFDDAISQARIGGTHSKELFSVHCALSALKIMLDQDGYKRLQTIGTKISKTFNNAAVEHGVEDKVTLYPVFGGSILDIRFENSLYQDFRLLRQLQSLLLDNKILHLVGHPSFISLAHSEINFENLEINFSKTLGFWVKHYKK